MRLVFQHSAGLFMIISSPFFLFLFFVIVVIQYLNSSPPLFQRLGPAGLETTTKKHPVQYVILTIHTHTTIVYTVHQLEDLAGHLVIATGCKKKYLFPFLSQLLLFGPAGSPQLASSGSMTHIINSERFLFSPLLIFWIFSLILLENISKKKEKKKKNLACVFTLGAGQGPDGHPYNGGPP